MVSLTKFLQFGLSMIMVVPKLIQWSVFRMYRIIFTVSLYVFEKAVCP